MDETWDMPSGAMNVPGEYRQYNIIDWNGLTWALPQALGVIDLENVEDRTNPLIICARSGEDIRALIDSYGRWEEWDPFYSPVSLDAFGLPEVVEIEPIHSCNLRCIMCHVSYEELTRTSLNPSFVQNLDGLQGKWAKVGSLYEPMAHPDIVEIMNGLSDIGMKIDLISNGSLFTDRLIQGVALRWSREIGQGAKVYSTG